MKRNDRTVGLLTVVITLAFAGACGEESAPVEPPSAPVEAAPPTNVPEEVVEAPTPPPSPITVAMREERYDDVCAELRRQAFSSHVCAFIAARARGERGSLNQRRLRQFFTNHRVRRLRGRIVAIYEESPTSPSYEVRVGGRSTILETTDTQFSTTGGFSMWAQRSDDEEIAFTSGRVRDVPVYLEFKLADDIMDLARERRADDYQPMARRLLDDLVLMWGIWRHEEAETEPEPVPVVEAVPGEVTPARRQQCRRHCRLYRSCRTLHLPHSACREDLTSECEVCREEGAHR